MPAIDTYGKDIQQIGPASNGAAVVPSDANDLTNVTRALICGADGNIAVNMRGGGSITFAAKAGSLYPISVSRVLSTGTTATGIVAFW